MNMVDITFIDPNKNEIDISVQTSMFNSQASVFVSISSSSGEFAHAHMPPAEAEEVALAILAELASQGKLSFSLGGISV